MPPGYNMDFDRSLSSGSPQLRSSSDGRGSPVLRSSSESLSQALAQQSLLGERSTTWPLGAEARSKYGIVKGKVEDDTSSAPSQFLPKTAKLLVDTLPLPARLSKRASSRSRFSLPTIQELKTYERDSNFAKLDERPKRGLNLPRSVSIRPSAMSKLLLSAASEFDDAETASTASPSPVPSRSKKNPAASSPSSAASSQDPPSPFSLPHQRRRTASSPGTPVPSSRQTKAGKTAGFFDAD